MQGNNPKTLPVWANEATGIDFVNVRNVLEPSCVIGNFFGLAPESMAEASCTALSLILSRAASQGSYTRART